MANTTTVLLKTLLPAFLIEFPPDGRLLESFGFKKLTGALGSGCPWATSRKDTLGIGLGEIRQADRWKGAAQGRRLARCRKPTGARPVREDSTA
jgi:hypothetical protein